MPIDLATPLIITPATIVDRFVICGFQIAERDFNSGTPNVPPRMTIYWVKMDKTTNRVQDRGQHFFDPTNLGMERADGTQTIRNNLKTRLYKVLQDDGIFPAGAVA